VGSDICLLVQAFYSNVVDLWRINQAHITLLPKKKGALQPKDYRPISVITGLLKIISKILANRLQKYLPTLINTHQSAFIKGRALMETFLVARESIFFWHKEKIPSVLIKVEFQKPFDLISWKFIINLMRAKGFPTKWIDWVKHILISSSSMIKVNGSERQTLFHRQGLGQRDPLSPLLFILVADVL
jgi:Reverse transcriptase (RNA-dependent DNA polymerase)